jgi:hypothetical protein
MAKTNATQRSLKYLRNRGWQCAIVEKWQMRPQAAYGVRIDVWGFGDILACRAFPDEEIALIQTFPMATWKAHMEKVQEPDIKWAIEMWKDSGGRVYLHGWALKPKDGVRKAKKVWTLREEQL